MAEFRVRIGNEGPLSPDEVAARGFTTVRRGFDPGDVRGFLHAVSGEIRRLRDRIDELERAASAQLEPGPPPAVDIATLTSALGEETARVLRTAQEAAVDVRIRAEEGAARVLHDAHEEGAQLRAAAELVLAERTEEAEAMAAKLRAEVEAEVAAIRARAETEAEAAISTAVERGRQMVTEAQAARERMLTDLARRRKGALIQLEQLRAGRDRLLEAYHAVRVSFEEVTAELERADVEARAAADAAARRASAEPQPSIEELIHHAAEMAPPGAAPSPASAPEAEAAAADSPPTAAPEAPARPAPGLGDRVPVATFPDAAVGGAAAGPGAATRGAGRAEAVEAESAAGVDQLFARIRADRATPEPTSDQPAVAGPEAAEPTAEPAGPEAAEPTAEPAGPEPMADGPTAEAPADEAGPSTEDERRLHQRDEAVDQMTTALGRKLRRLIQDEQNLVLDRLRTTKGKLTVAALLPDATDHAETYVEAVRPTLADVEAAGAALVTTGPPAAKADQGGLDGLAIDLATELVGPLRVRLERGLADDDDRDAATELIGAAYRELKSHRLEPAVGDRVAAALTFGVRRALPEGTPVRWIVDDVDGPCPDCDDNALAGAMPLGEPFPTGQPGPPAHPGCRCLLVAAPA